MHCPSQRVSSTNCPLCSPNIQRDVHPFPSPEQKQLKEEEISVNFQLIFCCVSILRAAPAQTEPTQRVPHAARTFAPGIAEGRVSRGHFLLTARGYCVLTEKRSSSFGISPFAQVRGMGALPSSGLGSARSRTGRTEASPGCGHPASRAARALSVPSQWDTQLIPAIPAHGGVRAELGMRLCPSLLH